MCKCTICFNHSQLILPNVFSFFLFLKIHESFGSYEPLLTAQIRERAVLWLSEKVQWMYITGWVNVEICIGKKSLPLYDYITRNSYHTKQEFSISSSILINIIKEILYQLTKSREVKTLEFENIRSDGRFKLSILKLCGWGTGRRKSCTVIIFYMISILKAK